MKDLVGILSSSPSLSHVAQCTKNRLEMFNIQPRWGIDEAFYWVNGRTNDPGEPIW